ncbi:YaaA family protein [Yonghaparkia sp. Soil809]|uniref:YaaA family protein n=1 Tax=Yonghaparkia sp. Soil809 TaxID=1736417 RepID=UPI000A8BE46E|nr:peroxide stress protein YaaA [Yonghaparkia sp. Soil809]
MTTLLLPPSETKRDGGAAGSSLDLAALSFPDLGDARRTVLDALASLAADDAAAARALKLSARAAERELARNRVVRSSPTLAAIDRYTGVLYDALDAATLARPARTRAEAHVLVHSALLGLIGAGDAIPAYRLSHDSRLPGIALKRHWSGANAEVLASIGGPILDLRSEGYAALGPLPQRDDALFVRVVSLGEDGATRALNHFNKKGKGAFVRALLERGPLPGSVEGVIAAAGECGWPMRPGAPGELELIVPATLEGFAAAG